VGGLFEMVSGCVRQSVGGLFEMVSGCVRTCVTWQSTPDASLG